MIIKYSSKLFFELPAKITFVAQDSTELYEIRTILLELPPPPWGGF